MPIFGEHWGEKFAILPQFVLFSTLGEMKLDHNFVQVSKLSEDPKKRSSTKTEHFFSQIQVKTKKKGGGSPTMEHFFSPNSSGHLRSDAHQSQIIGECRCRPYSNYWGGIQPNYWGHISPHPPRVSAPVIAAVAIRAIFDNFL